MTILEEIQKRGQLTERIKKKAKELLRYEINTTELRLMPYIIDVMMNAQTINPQVISGADRKILSKWRELGFIDGGASGLDVSEEFWNAICEIVFLGYVDTSP